MSTTKITRDLIRILRVEFDSALAAVAKKHGVSIQTGKGSFTDEYVNFKVNVAVIGKDGTAQTESLAYLKLYAEMDEIPLEFLNGKPFRIYGHVCTLTGYRPRAHKRPYLMKDVASGKEYIADRETLKYAMNIVEDTPPRTYKSMKTVFIVEGFRRRGGWDGPLCTLATREDATVWMNNFSAEDDASDCPAFFKFQIVSAQIPV